MKAGGKWSGTLRVSAAGGAAGGWKCLLRLSVINRILSLSFRKGLKGLGLQEGGAEQWGDGWVVGGHRGRAVRDDAELVEVHVGA